MFLIVLITILFLSACGHPKQAHVNCPSASAAGLNA